MACGLCLHRTVCVLHLAGASLRGLVADRPFPLPHARRCAVDGRGDHRGFSRHYRRDGFLAGNVDTGYLIASGSSGAPITSCYRLDDVALILDTMDREIRHFAAR